MSRILQAVRSKPWAIVAVVAVALLSAGAASAGAASESSEIEGVWSFKGGEVDVVAIPGGKFEGIVVTPTQFAECPHTEGEHMWTDITPQADGSYWGMHQWFQNMPAPCTKNPNLGPTAWRVLHEPNGARYLRVCFSHPSTTQPTIAANGDPKEASEYPAYHVTYGCDSSTLISPLPVVSNTPGSGSTGSGSTGSGSTGSGSTGPTESLTLPSTKQCLRIGLFKLKLSEPAYDPFKTVTITYKGHKIATSHKGNYIVATINLKGLSKSAFTIKVNATTILGHTLSSSRTYHICKPTKHGKKTKKAGKKG
jgi:hypothetical protein